MADLAVWQRTIVDETGLVVPGAEIEVRHAESGALAQLYQDREGTQALSNPATADISGFVRFFIEGGAYDITATGSGASRTWRFDATGRLKEFDEVVADVISGDAGEQAAIRDKLGALSRAGNLLDLDDLEEARSNLDAVSRAANLSDLTNLKQARANLGTFPSIADVQNSHIPLVMENITTQGFEAPGDGGGQTYHRVTSEPAHAGKVQSKDGAWWSLSTDLDEYDARCFGFGFGTPTQNADTYEAGVDFVMEFGGALVLPLGTFYVDRNLIINGPNAKPFAVRGRGMFGTRILKSQSGTGAFMGFTGCSEFTFSDLEVNPQKSVVGVGSHAVRMHSSSHYTVARVRVRDWTDTAIICFDNNDLTALYDGVRVEDCVIEGDEDSNNGILLANTKGGVIRGNQVFNLGKLGAPQFALQFKHSNVDGMIYGNYAENARAGVAMGSTVVSFPSNTGCRAFNNILKGCTRAQRISNSGYCSAEDAHIDMEGAADTGNPVQDASDTAFYMSTAYNCTMSGTVHSYEGDDYIVELRGCQGSSVYIKHWRNVPRTSNFVKLVNTTGCNVYLDKYVGSRPDFFMDWIDSDGGLNGISASDMHIAGRTNVQSGEVTVDNTLLTRMRLDTGGPANVDLVNINGGYDGQVVRFYITNNNRKVTVINGTGNIRLKNGTDFTFNNRYQVLALMYNRIHDVWMEAG